MKEVMIATQNLGKLKEFEHIFKPFKISVVSMQDLPMTLDIVEDGETFEANALIKAQAISAHYNGFIVADDSGLEVDALDKRPGVYSARYAGDDRSDEANMDKVLDELSDVKASDRTARFVCALALITPDKQSFVVRGTCEGQIALKRQGHEGFGYDPIFYLPSLHKTMAQIPKAEKNVLSHRAEAFAKLEQMLKAFN